MISTSTTLLGLSQAFWFAALVLLAVRRAVRPRALVTSALGLLISVVISTTATPPAIAVPLGVTVGTAIAVILSLATRHAITFTWSPNTKYYADNHPTPAENPLLAATALYFCIGALLLALT
ncbi:hypothetical protein GCM10009630_42530 [Kribbella jejuensis]|uniref:Uncharacterized protein n=1 Tax=Kribbella jejuensis TaxID=236068 RepID=A0A542EQR8_9ACTN|nr:hypothetical protein [Kribbella jejuensis]TQJ17526.1 hypothetical protein FB475_1646 [Kribbella jejuensis]